jgi:hypothetical protein
MMLKCLGALTAVVIAVAVAVGIALRQPTIKTIADMGSPGAPPADVRYRGACVLPALIDRHVHGLPPVGPPAALGGAYMFLMYLR